MDKYSFLCILSIHPFAIPALYASGCRLTRRFPSPLRITCQPEGSPPVRISALRAAPILACITPCPRFSRHHPGQGVSEPVFTPRFGVGRATQLDSTPCRAPWGEISREVVVLVLEGVGAFRMSCIKMNTIRYIYIYMHIILGHSCYGPKNVEIPRNTAYAVPFVADEPCKGPVGGRRRRCRQSSGLMYTRYFEISLRFQTPLQDVFQTYSQICISNIVYADLRMARDADTRVGPSRQTSQRCKVRNVSSVGAAPQLGRGRGRSGEVSGGSRAAVHGSRRRRGEPTLPLAETSLQLCTADPPHRHLCIRYSFASSISAPNFHKSP